MKSKSDDIGVIDLVLGLTEFFCDDDSVDVRCRAFVAGLSARLEIAEPDISRRLGQLLVRGG